MINREKFTAYGFLVLSQFMVGINIVGSKFLVDSVPILFLLAVRFCLATLLLFGLHLLLDAKKEGTLKPLAQLTKKDWFFIIIEALCAGIFFNFLMIWGLEYTGANAAGIITSALPAITVLLSTLILRERFNFKKSLCLAFATLGLVIINLDKLIGHGTQHSLFGDMLIVLALIPEASYYVLSRLHANRLPVFLISALMNVVNAIILIPVFFFSAHTVTLLSLSEWLVLFVIGAVSGLFYVFWYLGSAKVEGVVASLSTAIMPVATVIIAWLALGEIITGLQFLGMGLVMLSIVFCVQA